MAGQRQRKLLTATVNQYPLMAEVEEFTPPEVKKTMAVARGGKFIPDEVMVGMEKLTYSLKVKGATAGLLAAYGLQQGEVCQVDIKTSEQDKDGQIYAIHYSLSGEITSMKEDVVKMGNQPALTLAGSLMAYLKTENGSVIYDINTKTQKIDLGQGDLMAAHRRNVGLA
ncbi:phage major tail tube protein [Algicola sagamiensis]|uniref:phage major tail tube protein n=1 Tax=Algicola sagamiensis TaxID=163869 RepID=UPI0003749A58|nr:phage major tail tube protein [Algicola sagamiensis]